MTPTGLPDGNEIRKALAVLIRPGATFELRALPSRKSWVGSDLDEATEAAIELGAHNNLYYTLNPVREGHKKAAADADILSRYWLLIDCDPNREDVDRCATDDEKEAARELALAVVDYLADRDWPSPVIVDSGNGFQILYRVELPNTAGATTLIRDALKSLAVHCRHRAAHVDVAVHNASRIARLPGGWNRKGESTPDRPHRTCRLIVVPDGLEIASEAQLRELVGRKAKQKAGGHEGANGTAGPGNFKVPPVPPSGAAAWFKRALTVECAKVALAEAGNRHNAFRAAGRTLFGYVHHGFITEEEIIGGLTLAGRRAGLPDDEIRALLEWCRINGLANPLPWPEKLGERPRAKAKPAGEGEASSEQPRRLTIRGSEVVPKKVEWLWPDRVPVGFLTVFAGRTGLGKSFVTCHLAAIVTTGGILPGGHDLGGECGSVLIVSEDPHDTMLAPRLIEMGADMDEVFFMTWDAMASYSLEDIAMLEAAALEGGKLPRLLVIDPPTNFLGDKDEHKNAEVRQTLMRLVSWLQDKAIACILILHVNKQIGKGIEAINRVMGSVAWVSTSRIAHVFAPDPDDPERRIFACPKNNLGSLPKGLAYQIVKHGELAVVEWLGEVDTTADEAMSGEKRPPRRVIASQWLIDCFRANPRWVLHDLERAAKDEGISRGALYEARTLLKPQTEEVRTGRGRTTYWFVRPDWPPFTDPKWNAGTVELCPRNETQTKTETQDMSVPISVPAPRQLGTERTVPQFHSSTVSVEGCGGTAGIGAAIQALVGALFSFPVAADRVRKNMREEGFTVEQVEAAARAVEVVRFDKDGIEHWRLHNNEETSS